MRDDDATEAAVRRMEAQVDADWNAMVHHDTGALGLPYAAAEFDAAGRYHVVCPACGEKCYPASTGTEDDVTKGAGRAYAEHYTLMRTPAS